ncbi:MAG: EAL domain-containing protein [Pseudomonadota bacterium]
MKPLSIGRLALLYLTLSGLLLLAVGGYFWREAQRSAEQLRAHEARAARQELATALDAALGRLKSVGDALARWDETKQQLVFPEYYTLWRDNRARSVGLLPDTVRAIGLYGLDGGLLLGANSADPLPARLPGGTPLALFKREAGIEHIYYFLPVYADPDGTVPLGHLGLKLDLQDAMRQSAPFRYADLRSLRVDLPEGTAVAAEQAMRHIHVDALANRELESFQTMLRDTMSNLLLAAAASLVVAGLLLNRLLIHPLRHLSAEIDARRAPGSEIQPHKLRALPVLELENVRESFNDYQARLAELHHDLELRNRDFFDQARHDALSGVMNRRAFDEDWRDALQDRRLDNIALLLFDCDHFKAINDTYGHHVGDLVIQATAQCLLQALRADDRLYRLGGDEFAAMLTDTDKRQAGMVAERCLEQVIGHDFRQYGMSEPITISIGIALSEAERGKCPPITLTELQKRADLAMYAAKRPGGQKIMFYTPEIGTAEALVTSRAIHAVFRAIQDPGLIEIAYQAVIRLPQMEEAYAEALTRIRCDGELFFPCDIFPIVQCRNLDAEFDLAIIRAINRDLDNGVLPADKGISINLSASGIVNARVLDAMLALLEAERGRKIVVEITETALITQMETATENIRRLREAGALAALDDFGSGYSSLRYLASMPVDLVKFDISMVRLLETGDGKQRLMMEEITRMAINAGYELVAEGIESHELLDRAIGLGFAYAQGYYFGQPGETAAGATPAGCVAPCGAGALSPGN